MAMSNGYEPLVFFVTACVTEIDDSIFNRKSVILHYFKGSESIIPGLAAGYTEQIAVKTLYIGALTVRGNCMMGKTFTSFFLRPPRARMGGIIDLGQMLKIEVGVNLRSGYIGVPKQLLHCPQITTGFE